jgi:PDZ domain-containing protein
LASSKRLSQHLAKMLTLETTNAQLLLLLSNQAALHKEASSLLLRIRETTLTHQTSLQTRLDTVAPEFPRAEAPLPRANAVDTSYLVSAALQSASIILHQAIMGYAMLRTIALRNRDSILSGEDNTGDLAAESAKAYAGAVHMINQLIHDVVLWEMDQDGEICKCTCPSCGLGICLCAQAPRRTLSDTWTELGPISTDTAVTVQTPRPGSIAEQSGLQAGDVIVSADGKDLESHFMLQGIISGHHSGEAMELTVRRVSGKIEPIVLVCE